MPVPGAATATGPAARRGRAAAGTSHTPTMRIRTLISTVALLAAATAHAQQANISIDGPPLPGLFGRVQINAGLPLPPVYLPKPVVVNPPRVALPAPAEPVYLWVPPGHRKNWKAHCGRYDACGRPVYFVQERWVREHEPQRFEKRNRKRDRADDRGEHQGHGHGKGHGKGHDKD